MTAARYSGRCRMASIPPRRSTRPIGDDDSNNFSTWWRTEGVHHACPALEQDVTGNLDVVKHLDPREATIFSFRFGLDGGWSEPLEEVGEKFRGHREQVRQIKIWRLKKKLRRLIEKLESSKDKN